MNNLSAATSFHVAGAIIKKPRLNMKLEQTDSIFVRHRGQRVLQAPAFHKGEAAMLHISTVPSAR
jgi:hypothetical protein